MESMSDGFIAKYHHSPKFKSGVFNGKYSYFNLNPNVSKVTLLECTKFSHLMHFLHIKKIGKLIYIILLH